MSAGTPPTAHHAALTTEVLAPRLDTTPRWWRRLRRDPAFWITGGFLCALALVVYLGVYFVPYTESQQDLSSTFSAPSARHWFGTDALGRDLFTRTLYGGQISLAVGIVGALVSVLIGATVGGAAGLAGGFTERAVMRGIDVLYGIPLLLVVIALMVWLGSGLRNIFIALGLVYWLNMARVVRARVVQLRGEDYIAAARALGAGRVRIFLRHVLPNTTSVIVVTASFMVPQAIFAESFLSFLGLGVTVPHASWGMLAAEGLDAMRSHPHMLIAPGVAISVTMLAFQTLGEALRNALDPRQVEGD